MNKEELKRKAMVTGILLEMDRARSVMRGKMDHFRNSSAEEEDVNLAIEDLNNYLENIKTLEALYKEVSFND